MNRLPLFCITLICLLFACKTQKVAVQGTTDQRSERAMLNKDWKGNPETEFFVHLHLAGPMFPTGQWYYMFLDPKTGIMRDPSTGLFWIDIDDKVSPYPSKLRLQIPRISVGNFTLTQSDEKNLQLSTVGVDTESGPFSSAINGANITISEVDEYGIVNGHFSAYIQINGETHQLGGRFMLPNYTRNR